MHVWPGIEFLALLLEAAGVLLLFREVWRGHEAEGRVAYAQLERIEQPMRRGDWEEAWAAGMAQRKTDHVAAARAALGAVRVTPRTIDLMSVPPKATYWSPSPTHSRATSGDRLWIRNNVTTR